jgi:hypothetical protein
MHSMAAAYMHATYLDLVLVLVLLPVATERQYA